MATISPAITRALTVALKDAQVLTRDEATVALARRYAALIEAAERVASDLADVVPDDEQMAAKVARLAARVDAAAVVSDLGPKLLAALTALGMTPQGRAGGVRSGQGADPTVDALARLRQRRSASGKHNP